mmetsp:Transcript_34125/g.64309  ORF Transcript_34125/g.64309 Transcript_34125/m.64309 type:complete len:188 (-) Transcript_34125:1412-1975(-)
MNREDIWYARDCSVSRLQAFLDGEGCGPEDPAREYCNKFFDSPRFKVRVNGLFDKYDADKSGKLDRDEVVEMLASLSTSLMSALTGTGPEILQTSEDHEKIKQAYQKMFQDKQLQLDRSTFTALSKLIVAQLILSASINLPNDFRHAQVCCSLELHFYLRIVTRLQNLSCVTHRGPGVGVAYILMNC